MKFLRSSHLAIWALTVLMICGVLFFGLRTKSGETANAAMWLPEKKVLQFKNNGIAYIDDKKIIGHMGSTQAYTLELFVAAYSTTKKGFRPILMIHNGFDEDQLVVWQWGSSIITMNGDDYAYTRKLPRVAARNVLTPGELTLITITVSSQETKIHVNGKLAGLEKGWTLRIPTYKNKNVHMVLGNSVDGRHGWNGEIRGLTLRGRVQGDEEIQLSYKNWLSVDPSICNTGGEMLFCLDFAESTDKVSVVQPWNGHVLQIPSRMVVLQPTVLKGGLNQLSFNRLFLSDVFINILGFLPLGIFFCVSLKQTTPLCSTHALLCTVLFCFLLSLTIEISQAWLPSRTSSYIDVVCNTLGGWLGSMLTILTQQKKEKTQMS